MATLTEVRTALAELLKVELGMKYASPRAPSPLFPNTVFIRPQPGPLYVSFEDPASFMSPLVNLSAYLVGSTSNMEIAEAWLDDIIMKAATAGDTDPTLGGLCSGIMAKGIGETGLIDVEGGAPVLSAELRFQPFHLSP